MKEGVKECAGASLSENSDSGACWLAPSPAHGSPSLPRAFRALAAVVYAPRELSEQPWKGAELVVLPPCTSACVQAQMGSTIARLPTTPLAASSPLHHGSRSLAHPPPASAPPSPLCLDDTPRLPQEDELQEDLG